MRGAHDLSPSKSNRRRLPWAIRAGNRSGSACCSPHRRAKRRAAQRQRVRPGRRDVSRRRVLPGATGQLVDTQIGTAPPQRRALPHRRDSDRPLRPARQVGELAPPQPPITVGAGAEPPRGLTALRNCPRRRRRPGTEADFKPLKTCRWGSPAGSECGPAGAHARKWLELVVEAGPSGF